MKKYIVYLNALASTSYELTAKSHKDAYDRVLKELAHLSDCEAVDWDHDHPGEVLCMETDKTIEINELE